MLNHNPSLRASFKARQRGASMIELLVSILIFAFGMLGLVGLQTRTLSYGQVSLYRSQAAALTDDILDRMRTDRTTAKAGGWNTPLANAASSFTGTTIADTDRKDWKLQVESLLPEGKGEISVAAGVVTVKVTWFERGMTQSEAGGTTQTFETTSGL